MIYSLVYVSSATALLPPSELDAILAVSRRNNAALDISVMLLYRDGNVMQVLEGEERVVRVLFDRIERDPRHGGVITVWDGEQPERHFPDWSMAFRDLGRVDATRTPGFSPFLNTPLTAAAFTSRPTLAQQLLLVFKEVHATGVGYPRS